MEGKKKLMPYFAPKVGILAKATNKAAAITLNIDGAPIASRSHTHPSNSQTSRLITSSLSVGIPVQGLGFRV